jgi:hypothetical protein
MCQKDTQFNAVLCSVVSQGLVPGSSNLWELYVFIPTDFNDAKRGINQTFYFDREIRGDESATEDFSLVIHEAKKCVLDDFPELGEVWFIMSCQPLKSGGKGMLRAKS